MPGRDDDVYPCDAHERRITSLENRFENIANLSEARAKDLAVMQELLHRLDKALFGNGRPGEIDNLHQSDEKTDRRVKVLEIRFALAVGAMLAMQFLAGSGMLSLSKFLGK